MARNAVHGVHALLCYRLFDKHKQLEESQQEVSDLHQKITELNQQTKDLEKVIADREQEIVRLGFI